MRFRRVDKQYGEKLKNRDRIAVFYVACDSIDDTFSASDDKCEELHILLKKFILIKICIMDLLIPDELLKKAEISADELLIEIAIYLYDKERLSFGQAKALSRLNHLDFQKEMSKRDVYIKYDIDDLEEDLKNLNQFRNKKAS